MSGDGIAWIVAHLFIGVLARAGVTSIVDNLMKTETSIA
jgi:hypothetical protein